MLEYRHASRASQGGRNYQEDSAAVWPGPSPLAPKDPLPEGSALMAVLADGMGGHAAGDVASSTVCQVFLTSAGAHAGSAAERLSHGLLEANGAIRKKTQANPSLAGMGSTFIGVNFTTKGAEWVSVGDSLLFLFRRGEMVRLNQDHSLAPLIDQMVAEGKMDAEEARNDPRRHYLRSALTGEDLELVDTSDTALLLEPDDIVLLASDGIHTLEEEDIRRLIMAYRTDGVDAIAEALVRAVDHAGVPHQDNTTVIVVAAVAKKS